MNLVLGVLFIWLGSAFLWVAGHGVKTAEGTASSIWRTILSGIAGTP